MLLRRALALLDALFAKAVQALGRHWIAHQPEADGATQLNVQRCNLHTARLVPNINRVGGSVVSVIDGQRPFAARPIVVAQRREGGRHFSRLSVAKEGQGSRTEAKYKMISQGE